MLLILSKIVLDKMINKIIKLKHLFTIISIIKTKTSLKTSNIKEVLDNRIFSKKKENIKNKMIKIKWIKLMIKT
jgi:hypothetical protein